MAKCSGYDCEPLGFRVVTGVIQFRWVIQPVHIMAQQFPQLDFRHSHHLIEAGGGELIGQRAKVTRDRLSSPVNIGQEASLQCRRAE